MAREKKNVQVWAKAQRHIHGRPPRPTSLAVAPSQLEIEIAVACAPRQAGMLQRSAFDMITLLSPGA